MHKDNTKVCKFYRGAKWISYSLILMFLFVICVLVEVRYIFGEDGDLAWVIGQLELTKSYPLTPYTKEIILGTISFICWSIIALRYWKISIVCCLLTVTVFYGRTLLLHNDSSIFSTEYLIPRAYLPKDFSKKNIIVISLESIEDILARDDITKSGNLIPYLSELSEGGMIFDGYVDMTSMRPTIPSFFAKNCGIPTRTTDMDIYDRWTKKTDYTAFPNAKCVFDILGDAGYDIYYVMGSNLTDEGAASFFEKHPAKLALGKLELLAKGALQKESRHMLPDSELYKYAQKLLSAKHNTPFGLYIVTGNTHGAQKGGYYVEHGCSNTFGDYRDAVQCFDKVTYDFIKWCQAQDWYKDTIIYLIGDHLMRPSELRVFSDDAGKYPRQIFALMLNGNKTTKIVKRKYTQVDFAPTFLESLGFVCPALGLGRSLFREDKTLVEKFGEIELQSEIQNSWNDFQNIMHGKTFTTEGITIARIDITTPLVDANKPQFGVYLDGSKELQKQTAWLPKFNTQGYVIQKGWDIKNINIEISALNSVDITIALRGPNKRDENNNVIENWVTFTSMKINGEEILSTPQSVWLKKPFNHTIHAIAGKTYKIEATWQ